MAIGGTVGQGWAERALRVGDGSVSTFPSIHYIHVYPCGLMPTVSGPQVHAHVRDA